MLDVSDLLNDEQVPAPPTESLEPASALHLMWASYSCLCGQKYEGPLYHTPFLAKHRHLRRVVKNMYPSGALIFTPVETPSAYPDLPVKLEIHHITIPLCPTCAASRHLTPTEPSPNVHLTCDHVEIEHPMDNFWLSSQL